ncbi:hypothetical protein ACKWTF_004120 [Chironomus riparius]
MNNKHPKTTNFLTKKISNTQIFHYLDPFERWSKIPRISSKLLPDMFLFLSILANFMSFLTHFLTFCYSCDIKLFFNRKRNINQVLVHHFYEGNFKGRKDVLRIEL